MKKLLALLSALIVSSTLWTSQVIAKGDTLTVALLQTVKTLDPQTTTAGFMYTVMIHISETLFTIEKGEIIPLLAESWELKDDGVTYIIKLKKGVKFHNGEVMTADDVVYSFERSQSPIALAVKAQSMYLAEVKKLDDHTVMLKTTTPMGEVFLGSLTHPWSTIYNKKATEALGLDYGQHPVGTGKYTLKRMLVGDRVDLERFDGYHGQKAAFKNLIFRTVVESTSRTIELESGAVDVAVDFSPVDMGRITDNPNLEVVQVPSFRHYHIGFDVTKAPYDNQKVREAINIAINRPGIIKVVFRGLAEPARGPMPSGIMFSRYAESPDFVYDPARARELLKEAGFPSGFKAKLIVAERSDYQGVGTVVQNNLKEIGIDASISIVESGSLNDVIVRPKHEPFLYIWGGNVPTADPFFFLTPLFHSKTIGTTNRYYYNDPALDKLLDKGVSTLDKAERAAVYGRIWAHLNETLPQVSILAPMNLYGKVKNLKGVEFSPTVINYFGNAYFE